MTMVVDKMAMANWQNDWLTKWPVVKMATWQNDLPTKNTSWLKEQLG